MKVLSAEYGGVDGPILEDIVLHCLRAGEHSGKEFTLQLVDRFGTIGPNGVHICLVSAVMGETLRDFADRFWEGAKQGPPSRLVKRILKQLLLALDYSHGLGIVHTDIKMDNIMMQIPNESAIFEECQSDHWLGRSVLDMASAGYTRQFRLDAERNSPKTSPKRDISYREETPRKRVCTSPRPPESQVSQQQLNTKRRASSDMECSRKKVSRTRSPLNIPTKPQPTFAMNENHGSSAAPGIKKEKEEKGLDSPSELEFLRRPISLIDLYHRENRICPSWTALKTWEIPCTSLGRYYLAEDCCDEDLLHLDVALCDWGAARCDQIHTTETISPPLFRSPEVLIRAPWTTKTDIWMLGCLIFELVRNTRLFSGEATRFNEYNECVHLHEICEIFGPFPKSFLDQASNQHAVRHVFDEQGRVDEIEIGMRHENLWVGWSLMDQSWDECMSFMSMFTKMMKIDPAERLSAAELLEEPWLRDVEV
ncbi:hypothetical protein EG328_001337 [Venturia inaequalis]|uniref:non-specific serine/threonine protein kinase n=1 Tax=Venturia inaequalis TaxID=5025 RepID=A0A8H3UVU7_VENIN|nr:hypothetical protein EG327_007978 [Venturia inaequalis]KAE9978739.1 hypothetical protein EG328_001337 [Venturia inaequalis]